jgi:hypothetical protein
MTRRMVDLIGGVVTVAILLVGVLVFALPLHGGAGATMDQADDVRAQNAVQQTLLDSLTAQSADMTELDTDVARLRAGIPLTDRVEDLVELAVAATGAHGGTLLSVLPAPAAPFAPRTVEPGADGEAPTTDAAGAEAASGQEDVDGTQATDAADTAASAPPPAPAAASEDGPLQTEVTLQFDVPGVEAGTAIVDALRAGPRLVAVTRAEIATDDDGVTLTVTVLVFSRPDAS